MTKTRNEKNKETTSVVAPKRYEDGFKRQAVEHWLRRGKNGAQIAQELGISYPSLKDWKARYYGDATPERDTLEAENRALRRELARVSIRVRDSVLIAAKVA